MSVQDYTNDMIAQKESNEALAVANSTSKVSVWRNILYVVAYIANFNKELQDIHKQEVIALIDAQKHTNLNYYREVVFNYRDGHSFDTETLAYIGSYTDEEIEAAKIVKRAAAQAVTVNGIKKIFLKLATLDTDNNLTAIDADILQRINNHIFINAPAGTNFEAISNRADELKLEIDVYIDPQILQQNGDRVDGSENAVVANVVNNFFADENFKFDGEFIIAALEDAIQNTDGIESRAANIKVAQANHTVPAVWEEIVDRYTAYSGYYKVLDLKVNHLIKA